MESKEKTPVTEDGAPMRIASCCKCRFPAVWVRKALLTGDGYYCEDHAQTEPGFGMRTQRSYFQWEKIFELQIPKGHQLIIPGYEDLADLANVVHDMRYDGVAEFYAHAATVLDEQASRDWAKGRVQLSQLLDEAAENALKQQELFARIWTLCEPHMNVAK